MENFYHKTVHDTCEQLHTSKDGLKQSVAEDLLKQNGENILPKKREKSKFLMFLSQFCDIMIIILLVAAVVSIAVAIFQKSYSEIVDGVIILFIVLLNAIIGFYEEQKAQKDMQALEKQTSKLCKVRRDGEVKTINIKDLVVGDVVILQAGDIVPADLRLAMCANLQIDESSLTGESVAVEKDIEVLPISTSLADRKNMAFRGCNVTKGRGEGIVVATAEKTELGKIALSLASAKKDLSPLQKNIKTLGKIITVIVLLVATLTFVLEMVLKPNPDIMEAFLTAVAIAVAAIPESLPAVITIIMSIGVSKLSKKKVIVKTLSAVETLGSTSVICSDKTGTLTENKMTVTKIYQNKKLLDAKDEHDENLIKIMVLCNDTQIGHELVGDPTETALTSFAMKHFDVKKMLEENIRVDEIPFDSVRKLMSTLNKQDDKLVLNTKGAVDEVIKRCTKILIDGKEVELTKNHIDDIMSANHKMAQMALRVLAFAKKDCNGKQDCSEQNLVFVGLVGMIDPPRESAKQAVEKCKRAHMRPIMITGDHKDTAFAIARQLGICKNESEVMLGSKLDSLSDEEYLKVIGKINVYARVSPENKVRIVKTLKSLGNVVAMTGDGVNDAPSLSEADIGVGMGITGTDVTKESADLIVTDDNFATIVVAVEEGRRIYANIKKTVAFLFTANLGEIMALLLATIFFPQYVFLTPVQILFVNLITDSLPAIALGLEKADKNIMDIPPRSSKSTIFSNGTGYQIGIMGFVQTLMVILLYFITLTTNGDPIVASSVAFIALNLVQFGYLLSIRKNTSIFKNKWFDNKWIWIAILVGLSVVCIFALTPLSILLSLANIPLTSWLLCFAAMVVTMLLSELIKLCINLKSK